VANVKPATAEQTQEDRERIADYQGLTNSRGFQRLVEKEIKPRIRDAVSELVWGKNPEPETLKTQAKVLYLILKTVYDGAALPIPKEIQELGKRQED
jgi:hypothetical protein